MYPRGCWHFFALVVVRKEKSRFRSEAGGGLALAPKDPGHARVSDPGLMGLRGSCLERTGGIWGCPSGLSLALVCALLQGVGRTRVCL